MWCFSNPNGVGFVPKPNQSIDKALRQQKTCKLDLPKRKTDTKKQSFNLSVALDKCTLVA